MTQRSRRSSRILSSLAVGCALVLAVPGCAGPLRHGTPAGQPTGSAAASSAFRLAAPPPADVPVATVVGGGQHRADRADPAVVAPVVLQRGVRFAYNWILRGRLRTVPPHPPLPWPAPAAGRGQGLLLVFDAPAPALVEIRAFRQVTATDEPAGSPASIVICDPLSAAPCATRTADGAPATSFTLPPGGLWRVTANAAWSVPRAVVKQLGLPRRAVLVTASWLFSIRT